jgi:Flp pilus assembly protein TadD
VIGREAGTGALRRGSGRLLQAALLFEVINAAYLAAFDSATIAYHVQVVAHVVVGLLIIGLLLAHRRRVVADWLVRPAAAWARALLVLAAGAAALAILTALVLAWTGTATPYRGILALHVGASVAALAAAAGVAAARGRQTAARIAAALLLLAVAFPAAVRGSRLLWPPPAVVIENRHLPPPTADGEGGGPDNPFFPSSARTVGDRLIPSDFFLESKSCGNRGCHPDITTQWESSMHHFSSFNNQWYRKAVEYMQEVTGTRPSKWCGGCHDQAVLLTGRMDRPIVEQINAPESQAGIGCLVCHSIVHVKDTMGQGGYVLEYPELHRLVASRNPALHALYDYMIRLDPGPHKATMLKRFHRESTPEFCSACHKVHLDRPINHYRWLRGFDEYDAWQMSGVSGQGARSFYYPEHPKGCPDCHMPLVASHDKGNIEGFVHSHRFPGANTAVPFANRDDAQLQATRTLLTGGILTVDIFAASEASFSVAPKGGGGEGATEESAAPGAEEPLPATLVPDLGSATTLSGRAGGLPPAGTKQTAPVAPLDRAGPFLRPGGTYRFDVVARTRGIGHAFPGGTVDAFDVWLELKAVDATGRVLYWSGFLEDGGSGPLEAGAHRYRSLLIDAHDNPIDKRNAWAARALVYARLIPPGAADVGRYRVHLPQDAHGPITFTARMNYRKFSWYNTHFSYAGVPDPARPGAVTPDYDDRGFLFTGDTSGVSGRIKAVPDLPVIVVAEDRVVLPLLEPGSAAAAAPAPQPADRERWNDYGIGMLLQGDLASARAAFERVTALDPAYADGFVNVGRVLIQEGAHDAALPVLQQALRIDPDKASAHYFLALALKARGRYDDALAHLRSAAGRYPRDRVVRDQIGRILFLKRRPREAIEEFRKTLAIDPEDLSAHYNLMLCYRALGDETQEKLHEALYTRFKADEASQALTGAYRRLRPEDNLERQPIHEHRNRYRPEVRAARPAAAEDGAAGRRGAGR